MYCSHDCTCTLCRELRFLKQTKLSNQCKLKNKSTEKTAKELITRTKEFFLLKRRLSDLNEESYRKSIAQKMLTKSLSCNEIWKQFESRSMSSIIDTSSVRLNANDKLTNAMNENNHKTVIYFGDSIPSKRQHNQFQQQYTQRSPAIPTSSRKVHPTDKSDPDVQHAKRLCDEMIFKRQQSIRLPALNVMKTVEMHSNKSNEIESDVKIVSSESSNVMKQLKTVLEEKYNRKSNNEVISVEVKSHESSEQLILPNDMDITASALIESNDKNLPSFVESIVNGVINIKIEGSYDVATKLIQSIENDIDANDDKAMDDSANELFLDVGGEINNVYFDWSFVQDWRSR